jgi:hypothetical protein
MSPSVHPSSSIYLLSIHHLYHHLSSIHHHHNYYLFALFIYSSKRVDYLTHLLMGDSCLHHECDRWGLVAYISVWLDREHGHLQSLSRSMASMSMQRDATIDRVNRSSDNDDDDDDDDGRRRDSRAVLRKVLMNSLFTAVVVGTALHSALSIMSQQIDDSHTGSHQLFNQLRTAFNAVIQQHSSDIRPQEWIQGASTAIAKVIVIDPSNLLLRLMIYGTTVSDSQHTHSMHTLGSLYSDCLQWMQWDVSSALVVTWMLSPIVIWLHHIQSMTLVDISGSEIISIVRAVMRHTPSVPLPYLSNPMNHHNDGSALQRAEQPRRHSSDDDYPPSVSIMASPDAAAGIVIKGIGAFIDGRQVLKVLPRRCRCIHTMQCSVLSDHDMTVQLSSSVSLRYQLADQLICWSIIRMCNYALLPVPLPSC